MTTSSRVARDDTPRFSARIVPETSAGTPFPAEEQTVGPCWRAAYPGRLRPAAVPPPDLENEKS